MRISINTFKWYDPIWAAFIFFTRLPLWKLYQPPQESYKAVVEYWPLTGWLTGAIMAATLYVSVFLFSFEIAIILALSARLFLTGALHEDGLADFFDGFGGGRADKSRILAIMKDSRIGTYGVLSLIIYYVLLFFSLQAIGPTNALLSFLVVDPFSKMVAGQITQFLPYARSEEQAKIKTVYRKFTLRTGIIFFIQGIIPLLLFIRFTETFRWDILVFVPCLTMFILYMFMNKRIQGYTGDCCGAVFLLTELSMYLSITYCLNNL